ncbi:MAG: PrgI family protein [bacterium]
MERHAVPQNIMEVEFKLFGAFSIRQFGYLASGFLIAALIYFTKWPLVFRLVLIVFSVSMGLFLALIRINGQSSSTFVTNFIAQIFSSQTRIWKKRSVTPESLKETPQKQVHEEDQLVERITKRNQRIPLEALAAEPSYIPKAVLPDVVDKYEEQQLRQIDEYYQSETAKVNTNFVSPPIQRQVELPSLQASKSFNPVSTNNLQQGLAQDLSSLQNQHEPIINQPGYTTVVRSVAEVQQNQNEKLPDQHLHQEEQQRVNNLKAEIAKLQSELASSPPEKNNQTRVAEVSKPTGNVNNMNGLITNKTGKIISEAVVNIKDEKETLVRRILVDVQGKFFLRNPLPNGIYYIDISAQGFKFNRYKVILQGEQLYSFQFRAK